MESFEDFYQEGSNDYLGLTLSFFYGKVKFALWAFIWKEFMDFVEGFYVQVKKYSHIGEHKNSFALEV